MKINLNRPHEICLDASDECAIEIKDGFWLDTNEPMSSDEIEDLEINHQEALYVVLHNQWMRGKK